MTLPSTEAILAQINGKAAPTPTPVALPSTAQIVPHLQVPTLPQPVVAPAASPIAPAAPTPVPFSNINVGQTMGEKSFNEFPAPDPEAVSTEVKAGLSRVALRDTEGNIIPPKLQQQFLPNTQLTAGKPTIAHEIVSALPDGMQRVAEQALQTGSDMLSIMPTAMRDNNEKVRLWSGRLEDQGVPEDRAADLAFYYYFGSQKGTPGSSQAQSAAIAQQRFNALKPTSDELKSLKGSSFKQGLGTAFDIFGTIGGPEEEAAKEGGMAAGHFLDSIVGAPGDIAHSLFVGSDKASTIDALARAVQLRQASKDQTIPAITEILKSAGVEHGLAEQYAPILASSDFEGIKKGINAIDKLQSTSKLTTAAAPTAFEGFDDVSLKTLDKLIGRTTVSKTFIENLANQGDLKQPERDAIRSALEHEGDTVNVADFANKVKQDLLPLTKSTPEEPRYESTSLPSDIRGSVADYKERVYESPIKTSGSDLHFPDLSDNYFAHSRIEDLPPDSYKEGEYAPAPGTKGTTRRVIEIQSDLFQKGRLESERFGANDNMGYGDIANQEADFVKFAAEEKGISEQAAADLAENGDIQMDPDTELGRKYFDTRTASRDAELSKLEPFRNTWHERVIREEIKQAAKDGKIKLQFPTGETAMKIEGLGETQLFGLLQDGRSDRITPLTQENMKVGSVIKRNGDNWIITDVLGDGKFKAVPKKIYERQESILGGVPFARTAAIRLREETFDVSGKVDTENPIYKFYEKTVGKYLQNKYGAKLITDPQGVKWWEVPIDSKYAKAPVHAFGAGAGFYKDKDGKWHYNPVAGALGAVGAGIAHRAIPAELEGLAAEARKYDSADEFYKEAILARGQGIKPFEGLGVMWNKAGALTSEAFKAFTGDESFKTFFDKVKAYDDSLPKTAEEAASKYWDDVIKPKIAADEPIVLSGDDMKAHFGNDYDPERSDLYAKANYQNVKRAIQEKPGDFVMLGGGPGSGKTEFLSKKILGSGFKGILYDTTLSSYKGTEEILKTARAAGKNIRIYGIVPDLEKARGFTEARAAATGRAVTDEAFARGHSGFVSTMKQLLDDGALKPDEVHLYDMRNVTDKESADKLVQMDISARNPVDLLNKVQYNKEDISSLLKDTYERRKESIAAAGRGNEGAGSNGVAGRPSRVDRTNQGRSVGEDDAGREAGLGEEEPGSSGVETSIPPEDAAYAHAGLLDARAAQEQAIADAAKKQITDNVPLPPSVGDILAADGKKIPIERTPASPINDLVGGKDGKSWQSIVKGYMYNAKPTKRVHIFDYLATPEFVLEKVGLGKAAEMLQTAKDVYRTTLKREFETIEGWKSSLKETQYHTYDGVSKPHSPQDSSRLIFQYLDGKEKDVVSFMSDTELDVARDIRAYLKDWADRLHLPEDNQISRYITHIFDRTVEGKPNETFIDPDMAAIMDESPAKSVYDPFLQRRMGKEGYVEDVWRALDAYVKRASRKEAMDPALEEVEHMAQRLDEQTYDYVTKLTHRINLRPTKTEKGLDSFITQTPIGYRFTNRPTAFLTRKIRQVFFRGSLGLNFSSALRNLTQGANTYAKLGEKYTVVGYAKLFGRMAARNLQELYDEGILGEDLIQDKNFGLMKKGIQKFDKGLFSAFEFAEKINRGSAYFGAKSQAIDKGLSEAEAIKYAKRMVRETQFSFGNVDTPVFLNDDIIKTLTQMQSYNVKQFEFLSRMVKQKDFVGALRWTAASLAMVYSIGRLFGMTVEQLVPTIGLGGAPFTSFISGVGESFSSDPQKKQEGQAQVWRSLRSMIPGGTQIWKTIQGATALQNGRVETSDNKFKYAVGPGDAARALLFGPNTLPQAQNYFNTSSADRTKQEYDRLKDIRDTQGTDAVAAEWQKLSATDPSMISKLKTYADEESLGYTDEDRSIRALGVANGDRADAVYDKLNALGTKEAKAALWKDYVNKKIITSDVAKQLTDLLDGTTQEDSSETPPAVNEGTHSESSILDTVVTYAKAVGVDPETAFNRIFTGQIIKRVDNGTIIVDRMPLAASQAERVAQGGAAGTDGMNLDHTVPLELGGSNDKSNLKLVPESVWESYTPVENELGEALRANKISKKTAQDLITRFKSGEITAAQVAQEIAQ